jgi:4-amino-4-deoxy-L-arabinose transferase-like glycosyltransferase
MILSQEDSQSDRAKLIIVFGFAVLFRVIAIIITAWNRGPHFENYEIACYIIKGMGYSWNWEGMIHPQPTAIFPPLYTYFLAFFMYIFNNPSRWIYFTQAILNSLGVIPSYGLGKYFGDRTTGLVAAVLYAVFPEIVVGPTKMISEPLFIPAVILSLYLFVANKTGILSKNSLKKFFMLGIIVGLTTLIKTTGSFIILACFISLILNKSNRMLFIKAALVISFGFGLAISPWFIRNILVLKQPIILASNFGYNLWRGNHAWASGTGYLDPQHTSEAALSEEYKQYIEKNHPQDEVGLDNFYKQEALKFIKQDPARFIRLTIKRIIIFFTFDPTHPLTRNVAYISGYIFVLIFGIWGAIKAARLHKLDSVFYLLPFFILCFYAPIMMGPRYRTMAILILLMLSALPIAELLRKNKIIRKLISIP